MALNAATLKAELAPEIENQLRAALGLDATPYPSLTSYTQGMAEAIANKVVSHIKANAELNNATCTGTAAVVGAAATITNQPVTGGIK